MNRTQVVESLERRRYFSPLVFAPAVSFPTGTHPSAIAVADLTGNGIGDIVTANFGSASVAVLRGNGNSTFQPPVLYPVGNSPESLAIADFNGDGIPDIVTANEADDTISVLIGNGDGTFQPQVVYPVGVRPESVAVGDLTGNGLNDIVVADDGSGTVDVLMNNGDGTFQPAVSYSAGTDPDGVAVADLNGDQRPDIVVINPLGSYLHVLLNKGDGTFDAPVTYSTGQAPRAVAIADLNSDGRPDIITSSIHDTDINVLNGNGDGTFQDPQTYTTGFFPFSIAVADFNGDGRLDVATSNELDNTVSVLLHTGTGTFLPLAGYHAGQAPVAVAVGDFNGDGKPDIVAADFNTNSVSVLSNATVFPNLIPTTVTLSPNQNPVQLHNRVVLTAQVTASSTGSRKPIGVVQFFDGDAVIGVAPVLANGTAAIAPTKLTLGTHTITAHYAGDGLYKAATSSAVLQQVVEPAQTTPLVQPSILGVALPNEYVPGDRGVARVAITDVGDGTAVGVVGVQLYASTSSSFDSSAFPIATLGSGKARVQLAGGRTLVDPVTFTLPSTITAGNYTIFAALTPVSGLSASAVSSTVAVGLNSATAVLQFGRVPTHGNFKLTQTLSGGNTVSLSLSGPGTGKLVENGDGGIGVTLSNTTGNTVFTIAGSNVLLDSFIDYSPLSKFDAPTTIGNGQIGINGSAKDITLAGATNSFIFVGSGSAQGVLSLGTLSAVTLDSDLAVKSLTVSSWANTATDGITAPWIGSLSSAGDFGPSLSISSFHGAQRLGIGSATIAGTLGDATWSVDFNVGTVQAGAVGDGWSGSIHGTLESLIDTGDFAGDLAAHNIGNIQISGNLTDAAVLAGADFGATARLGVSGDDFGRGVLSSIVVNGSVTNSVVAAGLLPIDGVLLGAGTTLLKASAIRSITVSGTVDNASKFLAVSLPPMAKIDGLATSTAGNSIFTL